MDVDDDLGLPVPPPDSGLKAVGLTGGRPPPLSLSFRSKTTTTPTIAAMPRTVPAQIKCLKLLLLAAGVGVKTVRLEDGSLFVLPLGVCCGPHKTHRLGDVDRVR